MKNETFGQIFRRNLAEEQKNRPSPSIAQMFWAGLGLIGSLYSSNASPLLLGVIAWVLFDIRNVLLSNSKVMAEAASGVHRAYDKAQSPAP